MALFMWYCPPFQKRCECLLNVEWTGPGAGAGGRQAYRGAQVTCGQAEKLVLGEGCPGWVQVRSPVGLFPSKIFKVRVQKHWASLKCLRLVPPLRWAHVTFLTCLVIYRFNCRSEDTEIYQENQRVLCNQVSLELLADADSLLCISAWRCLTGSQLNSCFSPTLFIRMFLILASGTFILLVSQARPTGCLPFSSLSTSLVAKFCPFCILTVFCVCSFLVFLKPLLHFRSSALWNIAGFS